jgi:16S rRNA (cytosine967-C5)-methyltransferase
MTPAARLAAAIDILDRVLAGVAAEKALTNWARSNRFAGSGDRHAIRDTVFDALRCRRSFAHLGGGESGRALVLGAVRASGVDPETLFTGEGYAPAPLTAAEQQTPPPPEPLVALDCPEWLAPALRSSLGADFDAVLETLRHRAPVFLRVNLRKTDPAGAIAALAQDEITAVAHPLSPTALEVTRNPRKVQTARAYATGLVELQDAASQAVIDALPLRAGQRVLDYCAGGGGKSLAMGAKMPVQLFAHDIDPGRMKDIPERSARAGISVTRVDAAALAKAAPFDLVLADAPCSGSGSWRRAPEAKWAFTPERLRELCAIQAQILDKTAQLVAPGGVLAYATCSLLDAENGDQIAAFVQRRPEWQVLSSRRLTPLDGADGFFIAALARS